MEYPAFVQRCDRCEAPAAVRLAHCGPVQRPGLILSRRPIHLCPHHLSETVNPTALAALAAVAPHELIVIDPNYTRLVTEEVR